MKVFLDTVGCRLNQSEIERMARQFRAAGHELVGAPDQADLAVVNTCTVTREAAADSRSRLRAADRAGVEQIVATGCWATIEPAKAAALPGVRHVVTNARKELLVPEMPGLRMRTRAFIKVQDGCDNACTFCITTVARGGGRSRTIHEVLSDVGAALDGGTQEIVLTGVHLGSWGQEFDQPLHLRHLVETILKETDTPRLRLSSLEPWDLDADFFALWQDSRLCRHLHLPLQSGSRSVLKRMLRHTTPESFRDLVAAARQVMPQVAITTDVIAGFPGETEAEFAETLEFIREMDFAGGHVFTYSPRPGTPAARMKGQLPKEARKARNAALRGAFAEMETVFRRRFLGQALSVLWEASAQMDERGWQMQGLTDNYLRVSATAPAPRWNRIDAVRLSGLSDRGLTGEILRLS